MLKKICSIASLTVLVVVLTAIVGFSQGVTPADVCTTISSPDVTTPPGTNTAIIGVASNLYYPAQTFVGNYLSTKTNTSVTVCHNSTGNLEAQLFANHSKYDMLFAADDSVAPYNYPNDPEYPVLDYARGIPVIFAEYSASSPTMTTASQLISGASSSASFDTINASSLNGVYSVNSSLTGAATYDVAIADPALAPYGAAAETILTAMGYSVNFATPATPTPTWVYRPLFNNIAQTFTAVVNGTGTIRAGWVSKAQICSALGTTPPTYVYVEFKNSAYTLLQQATITTTNSVGKGLYDYIYDQKSNGGWATFLINNCYSSDGI
jgi:ABC-type molybdate transport system substrate-binding protein